MDTKTLELISLDIASLISKYADMLIKTRNMTAVRLVGTLEAAYNHCLSSIAGDGDIYCLVKHISYAIILAGELDGDVSDLYQILAVITKEKIQPCQACKSDSDEEQK